MSVLYLGLGNYTTKIGWSWDRGGEGVPRSDFLKSEVKESKGSGRCTTRDTNLLGKGESEKQGMDSKSRQELTVNELLETLSVDSTSSHIEGKCRVWFLTVIIKLVTDRGWSEIRGTSIFGVDGTSGWTKMVGYSPNCVSLINGILTYLLLQSFFTFVNPVLVLDTELVERTKVKLLVFSCKDWENLEEGGGVVLKERHNNVLSSFVNNSSTTSTLL